MSHVQEVRYRLLCEQLEQWLEKLSGEEQIDPEAVKELAVRLLTMAVMVLKQHQVNKRGQCQYCDWAQWYWRVWRRRSQCTVCSTLSFAMGQELTVVWWRLFGSVEKDVSLREVREWVARGEAEG